MKNKKQTPPARHAPAPYVVAVSQNQKLARPADKDGNPDAPIKTVYIPARAEHDGTHGINVKLRWVCPICGAPRGKISNGRSYDGSRVLFCNTWQNPCGHVDKYDDVRAEAAANGLNGDVFAGGH